MVVQLFMVYRAIAAGDDDDADTAGNSLQFAKGGKRNYRTQTDNSATSPFSRITITTAKPCVDIPIVHIGIVSYANCLCFGSLAFGAELLSLVELRLRLRLRGAWTIEMMTMTKMARWQGEEEITPQDAQTSNE